MFNYEIVEYIFFNNLDIIFRQTPSPSVDNRLVIN
jgi:hypothetical protein